MGSTYERQWDSEEPNLTVAQEQLLPKAKSLLSETPTILECRAALRVMHVGDYMPLAQQVTERTWVLGALGSRGLLYHAYLAQQLVSKIGDV